MFKTMMLTLMLILISVPAFSIVNSYGSLPDAPASSATFERIVGVAGVTWLQFLYLEPATEDIQVVLLPEEPSSALNDTILIRAGKFINMDKLERHHKIGFRVIPAGSTVVDGIWW